VTGSGSAVSATGRRAQVRGTLTARTTLLTAVIAVVAVVIAGLVSFPLLRGVAEDTTQAALSRQADIVADSLSGNGLTASGAIRPGLGRAQLLNLLKDQGITLRGLVPNSGVDEPLTQADLTAVGRGESISAIREMGAISSFVEVRPVGQGRGVALMQPVDAATADARRAITRFAIALVIGLLVAITLGVWVSRRMTGSLRRAAAAAHAIGQGDRNVRVTPEGPTEVAEIGAALEGLSEALRVSEERQREFLLSVSHELRTPLTSVRGYAEALADGLVPEQEVARVGETMADEAQRLDRLVRDLLDLARLGAVDFRLDVVEVQLSDILDSAAEVWRDRCLREGVEFSYQPHPEPLPDVLVDPLRLRQIVDNLAENALRVTPQGRPIVLACVIADPSPGSPGSPVRVGSPGRVGVELRDGGPGLRPDDLAVAFDPGELYERYRGIRRVGTGVGLALVGRLATRMGGRAEAGVAPEGGARFTVWLPTTLTAVSPEPAPRDVPLST